VFETVTVTLVDVLLPAASRAIAVNGTAAVRAAVVPTPPVVKSSAPRFAAEFELR
jgi:hypothetical protein